jgi:hypothetical protein
MGTTVGLNVAEWHTADEKAAQGIGFTLGQVAETYDGKTYIYVQLGTGGVTGDGYACIISSAYAAVMTDASNATVGMRIGIAEGAGAATEFGWLQIYGRCGIRTAASASATLWLHGTATAGELDDATQTDAGPCIMGLHIGTATGGAGAVNTTGFIDNPKGGLIPQEA